MRFLVPSGIFHPEAGGPATYLYHFLPALLAAGHEVEVVSFGDPPPQEAYPYPVHLIPRANLLKRTWAYRQTVRALAPRADRIFINNLGLPLPPLDQPKILKIVGDRAWERAINRGWIAPDEDIDAFQTRRYGLWVESTKLDRAQFARRADKIIVPSQYLKQMVSRWGVSPDKIYVIYNAFAPPPLPPVWPTRADLGLPTSAPLLLMVARLTAWKGLGMVLEALTTLPDLFLAIAGTGPVMTPMQAKSEALGLAGRVRFLGEIRRSDLPTYYRIADYTLLYSGYEGLSHVLLESLALGTPVIASHKGGNPEVVQDGVNGWLIPFPDVAALREGLAKAFQGDAPQRLRAGATLDLSRFAWEGLVAQTLAVLTS